MQQREGELDGPAQLPQGGCPLGVNVAEHQVLGHGHGMSNSSGVAGAFGKNESLESFGFCSEDFFDKVEPTFAISTLNILSCLPGACAMQFV